MADYIHHHNIPARRLDGPMTPEQQEAADRQQAELYASVEHLATNFFCPVSCGLELPRIWFLNPEKVPTVPNDAYFAYKIEFGHDKVGPREAAHIYYQHPEVLQQIDAKDERRRGHRAKRKRLQKLIEDRETDQGY
jgi:hypothetical protein